MKKFIKMMLAVFMVISLFGCGKKEEVKKYDNRDVNYPTKIETFDEPSVQIHYQRKDESYSSWTLWLWNPSGDDDSKEDDFNYQDDYGVIASYPISYFGCTENDRLGFIVKKKGVWTKDGTDNDRFIVFSNLQKDENNVYHVYLAGDDANIYTNSEKIISDEIYSASFTGEKSIYVNCSAKIEKYNIYCNGELLQSGDGAGRKVLPIDIESSADFSSKYSVTVEFRESGAELSSDISMTGLYNTDSFNNMYYYDGELGAIYTHNKTEFKVWSPVSEKIYLRIYESGTPTSISASGNDKYDEYEMTKGDKGVFSYTLDGDNEGKYYTYVVYNATYDGVEVVDPYAKSASVNGLRGMIVDFNKTNPEGWDSIKPLKYDRKQLTVYEMHIADITSSNTWTGSEDNRRKYLGVVEEGTTYTENGVTVTTGFDHIKELGVNAVQIQPIFDFANDELNYTFNWGYNPLNYNCLEGLYSSDSSDGYARIKEFKQLVQSFNKAGISVIMDVVYNHVNGALYSNFDVLVPGYYYRYNDNGTLSNGSGCGNETASENPMMRKFIIDSVTFWASEYKLGGYRFDLMGLHDLETMNLIEKELEKVNNNIVVYGEPWTGGGTTLPSDKQAVQVNANKFEGYGAFNDKLRDSLIKGGLSGPSEKGWVSNNENVIQNDVIALTNGINGKTYINSASIVEDPNKAISYVTCHDNYTLYDRMKAAGIEDEDTIRKMCVLANSVVFTSNGTSFMLSGEEFLRTKQGNSNSYNASDEINALDYSLKIKNNDVFENYKKLIQFKQNTKALYSDDNNMEINTLDNGSIITYKFTSNGIDYLVIHHNGVNTSTSVDISGYSLYLNTLGNDITGSNITPEPYQTLILKK